MKKLNVKDVVKSKWFIGLTFIITVFSLFGGLLKPTMKTSASDVQDFSLYTRSSEVTKAFGTQQAPNYDGGTDWLSKSNNQLRAGSSGSVLGYSPDLHTDDEDGRMGWVASVFSANSVDYDYQQLKSMGGHEGLGDNALYTYAMYGAHLVGTGLVDSDSDGFWFRKGIGILFSVLYTIASLVPSIFNIIIKLLAILNPFSFFFGISDSLSQTAIPFVGDVARLLSQLYLVVQDWALVVVVPVLIGLTALSIFMFAERGDGTKKLLRLVLKIFMIVGGLPLIGATYTSVIEGLSDNVSVGSSFADYIIVTQFVDSEGWMKTSRLAPPGNNTISLPPMYGSSINVLPAPAVSRNVVLDINKTRVAGGNILESMTDIDPDTDSSVADRSEFIDKDNFSNDTMVQNKTSEISRRLLRKYLANDRFSASDYEGFVKSQLDDDDVSNEVITEMFNSDAGDFTDDGTYGTLVSYLHGGNGSAEIGDIDLGWTIYNMGRLDYDKNSNVFGLADRGGSVVQDTGYINRYEPPILKKSEAISSHAVGLSPLAMYNFLNTEFSQVSLRVFSPKTSASSLTSNDYASVSRANHGVAGIFQLLESSVLIIASALLALFYGIGLVNVMMASIVRISSSVIGSAFGSMAMITKLLVSTVVLLVELIGSILLYQIFDKLLIGMVSGSSIIIELVPVDGFFPILMSIVTSLLVGSVVFFGIKNRKLFGKMLEEITKDTITKLMGGLDASVNQGGMFHDPQAVGKGAGAGTVIGDTGKVGGKGSGAYASKVAGGQDPDKERRGIKDALQEEKTQEAMRAYAAEQSGDESFVPASNEELAERAKDRWMDYKKAEAKDAVAGTMGDKVSGVLAHGGSALGVGSLADLDGGAVERTAMAEEMERRSISDKARGIGLGQDTDAKAKENAVVNDADAPTGIENYNHEVANVDNMTPDELIESGLDDELSAMSDDGGEVNANQVDYGTVAEAGVADEESDTYLPVDQVADSQMLEAFGDEADDISLDNEAQHISADPISEEYSDYIDNLDKAVTSQAKAVGGHIKQSKLEEGRAKQLDNQADKIEKAGNMTPEDQDKVRDLRYEAQQHRDLSEEHKERGRTAQRKGQKLMNKQKHAQNEQNKALRREGPNKQGVVSKNMGEFAKAQGQLDGLKADKERVDNALQQAKSSPDTPGNRQAVENLTKESNDLGQKINESSQSVSQLGEKAMQHIDGGAPIVDPNMSSREARNEYKQAQQSAVQVLGQAMNETQSIEDDNERLNVQQRILSNAKDSYSGSSAGQRVFEQALSSGFTAQRDELKDVQTNAKVSNRAKKATARINQRNKQMHDNKSRIENHLRPRGSFDLSNDMSENSGLSRKYEALQSAGINSQSAYNERMQDLMSDVNTYGSQLQQAETQLSQAKRSGSKRRIKQQSNNVRRIKNQLEQAENNSKYEREFLERNVAGLTYGTGYSPRNKVIGERINADMSKVASVVEAFGKNTTVLDKLKGVPNLTSEQKVQTERIQKNSDKLRKQLIQAGVSKDMLGSKEDIHELVHLVNEEWTSLREGKR